MHIINLILDAVLPDDTSFASLAGTVSEKTLNGVKEMGFTNMTEIQHKSIAPLLKGRYSKTFEM